MGKFALLLVLMALLVVKRVKAQEENVLEEVVRDLLEDMAIDGRLSENGDEAEDLYAIADNKIDINSATADELRSLHVLKEAQIQSIIEERNKMGAFTSALDLLMLKDFDEWLVERLRHFIKVEDEVDIVKPRKIKGEFVFRASRQLQESKGYTQGAKNPYLGKPIKLLSRNKIEINEVYSLGFVSESDAGEPIGRYGIRVTDFLSGYFAYKKNKNGLARAVVGHYHAHVGQGLGLWTGFSADNTSLQSSLDKNAEPISPTLSASEYGYLRGVAGTLVHNKSYFTLFMSHTDNDASIFRREADSSSVWIQTIQADGYHRTKTEIEGRNNVSLMVGGGYASQGFNGERIGGKVGIGLNKWHSSKALYNEDKLYRINYPNTDDIVTLHTDHRIMFSRVKMYGEVAYQISEDKALAVMQAMDLALRGGSYLTIGYRSFGRHYYAAVQSPWSRWSQPSSEEGLYIGIQASPHTDVTLLASANLYKNRWLTYKCQSPSSGYKFRINLSYTPVKWNEITLRVRMDGNEVTSAAANYKLQQEKRVSYKIQYQSSPVDWVRFKGGIEIIHYRKEREASSDGVWLSQEIKISFDKLCKMRATLYMAHFDTDDYNSRVYVYMPDVLYTMSTPMFSGRGVVAMGQISLNPHPDLSLALRIKHVRYLDRDKIGTGNEEVDGSRKSEVKLQLRYKLFHRFG